MLIELKEANIGYEVRQVLTGVNFDMDSGQLVFITGQVGSGKSTFLKALYGEARIYRARKAEVLGFNLLKLRRRHKVLLRRQIGFVFQDMLLLPDRNVYDNLKFVLQSAGYRNPLQIKRRIFEVLTEVGLEAVANLYPYELSGGQEQKVAIARAMLNNPKIILADEPTGNLDFDSGKQIMENFVELVRNGRSVIVVTHNLKWPELYGEKGLIYEVKDGRLIKL